MINFHKIKNKIKRIKSKFNKDQRNFHQIDITKEFLLKNFAFNFNKTHLSENGLKRIFKFAKKIKKDFYKKEKKDMWSLIESDKDHRDLFEACLQLNKKKFLHLIDNAGKTKLVYGFLNRFSYSDLIKNENYKIKESMHVIDSLISLSEYSKKIKVFCPEQGGWVVENINYSNLVKKNFLSNKKIIKPFVSPNFAYGLKLKKKFYGIKDINGLYSALKINNILKNYKINQINEIGAGLGVVAYYVNTMSNLSYSVFDLPTINILQAFFLMTSLGEKKISLFGERAKVNQIKIFPYWKIFEQKISRTLWFNQDSIPEIEKSLAIKYLKKIMSKNNCFLYSINQEARNFNDVSEFQHTLSDILNNKKFKLIYRSRDFMRQGYVEELFKII